jgi:hypothetical protein
MIKYFALSPQQAVTFETGFIVTDDSNEKYYFESYELAKKIMKEDKFSDLFSEREEDRINFDGHNETYGY